MSRMIRITAGDVVVGAELNDTATASLIWNILPIKGRVNLWGEEIYFSIPLDSPLDDSARDVVGVGDMGYWPPGRALCIFFGLTPMSRPGEIRPASAVNVVGTLTDDPQLLKTVTAGRDINVHKDESGDH